MRTLGLIVAVLAAFLAAPAGAVELKYTATLTGAGEEPATGSKAVGQATLVVDMQKQTVSLSLKVTGLKLADLYDKLANAPVGPMHLHHYAADGNVTLIMPFPLGPNYADTADGFTVAVKDYPYAEGVKLVGSTISFGDFLTAMNAGAIVLNIHTDKFVGGEIGGKVMPAP